MRFLRILMNGRTYWAHNDPRGRSITERFVFAGLKETAAVLPTDRVVQGGAWIDREV